MNNNEISLAITNINDNTTTTSSISSSERIYTHIPKDLFSCLICYETFGVDQQQLVALKCGHMFCASCIHQWLTTNKGLYIKILPKWRFTYHYFQFIDICLVCPTCRKRCWLKDILYIDVSTCIVVYGKKKIDSLTIERDRLNNDIKKLKSSISNIRQNTRKIENRLKLKQRLLNRLRYISKHRNR